MHIRPAPDKPRAIVHTAGNARHPAAARPPGPAAFARACRAAQAAAQPGHRPRHALAAARPVCAVSRFRDRRRRRTGGAVAGPAGGVAASDALVRHAAAAQAVARRGVHLRLGLWSRRHAARPARTCGWWSPPAAPSSRIGSTATTASSSTRSGRLTNRPRNWPACASCRRWCCMALTGSSDAEIAEHVERLVDYLHRWPDWPEIADLMPCIQGEAPAGERPLPVDETEVPTPPGAAMRPTAWRDRPRTPQADRSDTPMSNWLLSSLVYLAAAVIAVPLARLLGLGSIIGYLGRRHRDRPVGPEVGHRCAAHPALRRVRRRADAVPGRPGVASATLVGDAPADLRLGQRAVVRLGRADDRVAVVLGATWRVALVAALALADSSTAIGLGVCWPSATCCTTTAGQSMLSVMLLQDMAVIPILAFMPLLAAGGLHARRQHAGSARPRRSA